MLVEGDQPQILIRVIPIMLSRSHLRRLCLLSQDHESPILEAPPEAHEKLRSKDNRVLHPVCDLKREGTIRGKGGENIRFPTNRLRFIWGGQEGDHIRGP